MYWFLIYKSNPREICRQTWMGFVKCHEARGVVVVVVLGGRLSGVSRVAIACRFEMVI